MRAYAGIGSRATPGDVVVLMEQFAQLAKARGWVCRSGGAEGADAAFLRGDPDAELYLPWRGFNGHQRPVLHQPTGPAHLLAERFHPNWHMLTARARALHARNTHIVLGRDCNSPVRVVICWTPDGEEVGGTSQALRIARRWNIPILNLALPAHRERVEFVIWRSDHADRAVLVHAGDPAPGRAA